MALEFDNFHYFFIHNVFGAFIADSLQYFGSYLYPRFEYKLVSTYDKAVTYLNSKNELGHELDRPALPALILNPSGEFGTDEANAGGKQYWRFANLAPRFAADLFEPVYQDNNLRINVAFMRVKGEFELLMLLNSFYELFDLKIFLLQIFGGEGRPIDPQFFNTFVILPDELHTFRYQNDVTGKDYSLDWDSAGVYQELIETTNKNEWVLPGKLKPRFSLRGISDGSTRHGGIDSLADWRLSAQVEYELELPVFMTLETDWVVEKIETNFSYGSSYSLYEDYNVPVQEHKIITEWDSGLSNPHNSEFDLPDEATSVIHLEIEFKTRYFHQVLESEISDGTSNLILDLPEVIADPVLLKVQSASGLMNYWDHWELITNGTQLEIKTSTNVTLVAGDFIEIYVYESVIFVPGVPVKMIAAGSIESDVDDSMLEVIKALNGSSYSVSNVYTDALITGIVEILATSVSITSDTTAALLIGVVELLASSTVITSDTTSEILIGIQESLSSSIDCTTSIIAELDIGNSEIFSGLVDCTSNVIAEISTGIIRELSGFVDATSSIIAELGLTASVHFTASTDSTSNVEADLIIGDPEALTGAALGVTNVSSALILGVVELLASSTIITSDTTSELEIGNQEILNGTSNSATDTTAYISLGDPEILTATSSIESNVTANLITGVIELLASSTIITSDTTSELEIGNSEVLSATSNSTTDATAEIDFGTSETMNAESTISSDATSELLVTGPFAWDENSVGDNITLSGLPKDSVAENTVEDSDESWAKGLEGKDSGKLYFEIEII